MKHAPDWHPLKANASDRKSDEDKFWKAFTNHLRRRGGLDAGSSGGSHVRKCTMNEDVRTWLGWCHRVATRLQPCSIRVSEGFAHTLDPGYAPHLITELKLRLNTRLHNAAPFKLCPNNDFSRTSLSPNYNIMAKKKNKQVSGHTILTILYSYMIA